MHFAGNLYQLTAITFIGMLNCIAIFPMERSIFYREYVDGIYPPLVFFLNYFLLSIPFLVVSSVIISALMVFAINLHPTFDALVLFTFVTFGFTFVGECIGVMFCCVFDHVGVSTNLTSVVISIFCLLAGFISVSIPEVLQDFNYIR